VDGMVSPPERGSGEPVARLERDGYLSRVVIDAVLLARFGSAVAAETVTVFVIEVFLAITVTTIWTGLLAPLAREARLQLTTPDAPGLGVTQMPPVIVA